jgi:hypothetical protein
MEALANSRMLLGFCQQIFASSARYLCVLPKHYATAKILAAVLPKTEPEDHNMTPIAHRVWYL